VSTLTCRVLGARERHLESIMQSTLRQIILIHNFPRTLIQVTLQITSTPENENAGSKLVQAASVYACKTGQVDEVLIQSIQNLPILPALLQTSILALLSASMPLSMTLTSALLALTSDGTAKRIIRNPTLIQSQVADSLHVLAFTSQGDLLVAESEGSFTIGDWDEIYEAGKAICCHETKIAEDHEMADEKDGGMQMFVKSILQAKVAADLHWKE
jgi:exosome complex component RRP46